MFKRWSQAVMVAGVLLLPVAYGQEKKVKDQAEFDLIQLVQKEPDAKKRVDLIQQWKDKYPTSDFKSERLQAMIATQQAAGNAAGMRDAAYELIKEDPKSIAGYASAVALTVSMGDKSPEALANSEKAAQGALEMLPTFTKPANVTDPQWDAYKKDVQLNAMKALGFIKMSRNDYTGAEEAYLNILKIMPNLADVSLNAATAVLRQKNDARQAVALFHYARAASFTGPGALPEASRNQAMSFFKKNYVILRDNETKIDEFIAKTKDSAIPPADLKIESVAEELNRELEKLKETNPQLALWIQVKKELVGANGDAYFKESVLGTGLPKLKGKVISHTPALRPTKVVLALENDKDGEMTLVFAPGLPGKADPGTEIEFEGGIPKAFTKDPFNLTVAVDAGSVTGWPVAVPAAKPAVPVRPRVPVPAPKKK
ncbi:MAG: hypothetical protein K2X03_22150 [Bryobacteraceae bacterium]|nr:hypothetical protein [Bryobacteraceae bacterium]